MKIDKFIFVPPSVIVPHICHVTKNNVGNLIKGNSVPAYSCSLQDLALLFPLVVFRGILRFHGLSS